MHYAMTMTHTGMAMYIVVTMMNNNKEELA